MKLSLAWIFDHIDADWKQYKAADIVATFNQVVAEIEHYYPVALPAQKHYMVTIQAVHSLVDAYSVELDKKITLPLRSDLIVAASSAQEVVAYLVTKNQAGEFAWSTLADFELERDGLVPAMSLSDTQLDGSWREILGAADVIIEVDNKSITHRPDMWGHRGFAREIAAYLGLKLKPEQLFLKEVAMIQKTSVFAAKNDMPFTVRNEAKSCSVFNGLYIPSITNKPTTLFLASRLMRVGSRPMNALVDLTNYITLDWSQPVHAYDAATIKNNEVVVRNARKGERLLLLDGVDIALTEQDLVIANAQEPMCLAGVKGGKQYSVSEQTNTLFFESACFEAATIRRSALRHKTRTDSSARFEKTLDPYQAQQAIARFVFLAEQVGLQFSVASYGVTLGVLPKPLVIEVAHDFLQSRSGVVLTHDQIKKLLEPLGFGVTVISTAPLVYAVAVPSFRASKDIKIKEDILEEVVRTYGFAKIEPSLPLLYRRAFNMAPLRRLRKLKHFLVDYAKMTEVQNYSLYDEQSLARLALAEPSVATIINPVSEQSQRLIATLLPGLFKNVQENHVHRDSLALFEAARVWRGTSSEIQEKRMLAGIFFEKRKKIDFYSCKNVLSLLIEAIELDSEQLRLEKINAPEKIYYKPYQTMALYYNDVCIGYAGIVNPIFIAQLDILPTAEAFIFEIDITELLSMAVPAKRFVSYSRYQETSFDLSLMVPLSVTAEEINNKLQALSPLIHTVELLDLFEKDEWEDKRSLTFRVWLAHHERSLVKTEIDEVWANARALVQSLGIELRS